MYKHMWQELMVGLSSLDGVGSARRLWLRPLTIVFSFVVCAASASSHPRSNDPPSSDCPARNALRFKRHRATATGTAPAAAMALSGLLEVYPGSSGRSCCHESVRPVARVRKTATSSVVGCALKSPHTTVTAALLCTAVAGQRQLFVSLSRARSTRGGATAAAYTVAVPVRRDLLAGLLISRTPELDYQ